MFNVVIVDDHPVFREGIKFLLTKNKFATIIAEFENGKDFIEQLPLLKPDVILMDIEMPVMNGIEATKKAISNNPNLTILALTMFGDELYYQQMIQNGIKGFILKTSKLAELEEAIKVVCSGGNYFSQEILQKIIAKYNKPAQKLDISERELQILELICSGLTNEEIAQKINLSVAGVKYNRTNLLTKTNCNNTASLIIFAIKNNIISI